MVTVPDQIRTVKAFMGYGPCEQSQQQMEIKYTDTRLIGNGSFGVVYRARLLNPPDQDGEFLVAIKKVLQDHRFKNRELQIMRQLQHPNIVRLLYYFYSKGDRNNEDFLNLILEYLPETVSRVERYYIKCKQHMPLFFVKLYMYQVFRALAYIHSCGICHRDVKPQNLLLNTETALLKLCDFGSAKFLVRGESNVSYICSRYYRAPELIFGADNYSTAVDIWSTGCVFGEILQSRPMFTGDSGVDQLVEIIKLLGTPTSTQISDMNPNFSAFQFPKIKAQSLQKFFGARVPQDATDLIGKLLEYAPTVRITPKQAMSHRFFDELRAPNCKLPSGRDLPPLFDFGERELAIEPHLNDQVLSQQQLQQQQYLSANNNNVDAQSKDRASTTTTNDDIVITNMNVNNNNNCLSRSTNESNLSNAATTTNSTTTTSDPSPQDDSGISSSNSKETPETGPLK